MDIFSKRDGPRAEDVKAKRLIQKNAGTIRKLADQISNGGFTKMRQDQARRSEQPKPEGLIIHDLKAPSKSEVPEPYVKVSLNNRVVLVDRVNGRQLQLLGEVRGNSFEKRFVLATKANGFLSPVEEDVFQAIGDLDNVELSKAFSEKDLAKQIETALGIGER
ncbi:hypothetical protein [Antarctobacter jejuensis]|uniref:hypothetical protein n=1 Tax=Antarctobacter jejuensis TaxID=1439938 RepID=UPI003FD22930